MRGFGQFLGDHFALVVSLSVFVVFSVVGTVIAGQSEKDFGNGCEWDPDMFEEQNYVWTDDANKHLEPAPGGALYMWVTPVLVHEFGHTFGLRHSTFGLMNPDDVLTAYKAIATIQPADVAAIRQLYDGHTAAGW